MRKGPFLSIYHQMLRLIWCLRMKNKDLSKVLFVDETSVRIRDLPIYQWRTPSSYPEASSITSGVKKKLNVFGGISYKGATKFAVRFSKILSIYIWSANLVLNNGKVFKQNMDANLYSIIIKKFVLPFAAAEYDFDCTIHQDNDPKHNSLLCRNLLERFNIEWIRAPPNSPDLNVIEMLWNDLQTKVRSEKCTTAEEVGQAIHDFQMSLTAEKCRKYIDKLPSIIEKVIKEWRVV